MNMHIDTSAAKCRTAISGFITIPRWYAVVGLVVVAAVAGVLGYAVRDSRSAGGAVAGGKPAAAQSNAPAVTRLPLRTFGHWNLACVQKDLNAKSCEMVLRVVDKASKKLVLNLVVARGQDRSAVLVVVTPPNALLREPVRLRMAENTESKIDYATCGTGACRAVSPLAADLQNALAASDTIQITYMNAQGRTISYNLPNDGFKEAIAAWSAE